MRKDTSGADTQPEDAGVTLTLTAEQLEALGVKKRPAAGATLQLQGTASVSASGKTRAVRDTDGDADVDVQGGDDDGDEAGADAASGVITLHITGLTLTPARQAPDQVLYGGGNY